MTPAIRVLRSAPLVPSGHSPRKQGETTITAPHPGMMPWIIPTNPRPSNLAHTSSTSSHVRGGLQVVGISGDEGDASSGSASRSGS